MKRVDLYMIVWGRVANNNVCYGSLITKSTAPQFVPSSALLVGSSCEKVEKRTRRSSKDLWDEDSQMGLNTATTGSGVGAAELPVEGACGCAQEARRRGHVLATAWLLFAA